MIGVIEEPDVVLDLAAPMLYVNWWTFHGPQIFICSICDHEDHVAAGDMLGSHCKRHTSIEAAASDALVLDALSDVDCDRVWVGAYPEGERPS